MDKKLDKKGFTLIELLVVIGLMLSILAIAIVSLITISNRKKEQAWTLVKEQIETAAIEYVTANEYLKESFTEPGDIIYKIYVGKLVEEDYLNKVTNPITGKMVPYCSYVSVFQDKTVKAKYNEESMATAQEGSLCNVVTVMEEGATNLNLTYYKADEKNNLTKELVNPENSWFNINSLGEKRLAYACITSEKNKIDNEKEVLFSSELKNKFVVNEAGEKTINKSNNMICALLNQSQKGTITVNYTNSDGKKTQVTDIIGLDTIAPTVNLVVESDNSYPNWSFEASDLITSKSNETPSLYVKYDSLNVYEQLGSARYNDGTKINKLEKNFYILNYSNINSDFKDNKNVLEYVKNKKLIDDDLYVIRKNSSNYNFGSFDDLFIKFVNRYNKGDYINGKGFYTSEFRWPSNNNGMFSKDNKWEIIDTLKDYGYIVYKEGLFCQEDAGFDSYSYENKKERKSCTDAKVFCKVTTGGGHDECYEFIKSKVVAYPQNIELHLFYWNFVNNILKKGKYLDEEKFSVAKIENFANNKQINGTIMNATITTKDEISGVNQYGFSKTSNASDREYFYKSDKSLKYYIKESANYNDILNSFYKNSSSVWNRYLNLYYTDLISKREKNSSPSDNKSGYLLANMVDEMENKIDKENQVRLDKMLNDISLDGYVIGNVPKKTFDTPIVNEEKTYKVDKLISPYIYDGSTDKVKVYVYDAAGNKGEGSYDYVLYKQCVDTSLSPSKINETYECRYDDCSNSKNSRGTQYKCSTYESIGVDPVTGFYCNDGDGTYKNCEKIEENSSACAACSKETTTKSSSTSNKSYSAKAFKWYDLEKNCNKDSKITFTSKCNNNESGINCNPTGPYKKYKFIELECDCEIKNGTLSVKKVNNITPDTHPDGYSYIIYHNSDNGVEACNTTGSQGNRYVKQICKHESTGDNYQFHGVKWNKNGDGYNNWNGQGWYNNGYTIKASLVDIKDNNAACMWACDKKR